MNKKTSNTNFYNNSNRNRDIEGPQMTSNYLKRPQSSSNGEKVKAKQKHLKGGFVYDNVEINENYLDEILHNNNS